MKIKIHQADSLFSKWIRKRDRRCVRPGCFNIVEFNEKGEAVSLQCSHYWGRGNWNTRFDPDNCDTLCMSCHMKWGGEERRDYEEFKRKQLGEKRYKNLEIRKNFYCKKDPKLALMFVKTLA